MGSGATGEQRGDLRPENVGQHQQRMGARGSAIPSMQ